MDEAERDDRPKGKGMALIGYLDRIDSDADEALTACGPSVLFLLRRTVEQIRRGYHRRDDDALFAGRQNSSDLLALAKEMVNSFHYNSVPPCWRHLYTASSMLQAVALSSASDADSEDHLAAVGLLDMAIIVAGSEYWRDDVISLLRAIQAKLPDAGAERPSKRPRRAHPVATSSLPAPKIAHPLPVFDRPPSLGDFLSSHSKTPFVVRRFCAGWPASTSSPWRDLEHLRRMAGPGRIVPVEVGHDYTGEKWGQQIVGWEAFLDSVVRRPKETMGADDDQDDGVLYLAQHDLFRQFPELRADVVLPDYIYSDLAAPADSPDYRPPATEDGYTLNAWLGPAGTVSPAHTDPFFNCYAQVVGRKFVWVAPPKCGRWMYPHGLGEEAQGADSNPLADLMTNTTRVDVLADGDDTSRYPEFVANVMPLAKQIVLEEGDLFFMPPGWWHSMKALSTSFSVSIWF